MAAWARAEAAELTKLAETTYRDVNIALANEFARYADRSGIDVDRGDRRRQLPALQPHPPAGRRGRRALHPGLPALLPRRATPTRACRGAAREVNERDARLRGRPARATLGTLAGARVVILGVAYRGDVKETAFSGAFPLRDALVARGAEPRRHRPALRRRRAARARLQPGTGATRSTPRSCRPTTPRYARADADDLPGVARRSSTAAACSTARASPPPASPLRRIGGG